MSERRCDVLFIPVSGPEGAGEYLRCDLLARQLQSRDPQCRMHFLLNRHARYAAAVAWPSTWLERSATQETAAVNAAIASLRPRVVVFDNAGRAAQLRSAKVVGAHTICIASRPSSRRKLLRVSRLRHIDELWWAQAPFALPPANVWQRLLLRLFKGTQQFAMGVVFERMPDSQAWLAAQWPQLRAEEYVVLCPGGGGRAENGAEPVTVMRAAAAELAVTTVLVAGPNALSSSADGAANHHEISSLANRELMALLEHARCVVCTGGDVLVQALELGAAIVAAPAQSDQPQRIARAAETGAVLASTLDADAIFMATQSILGDAEKRSSLRAAARVLAVRSDLPGALARLESALAA